MTATADDSIPKDEPAAIGQVLRGPARYAFGVGFALASSVTAIVIFLTATAPSSRPAAGPSDVIVTALSLNLLLILALSAGAGWRALQLFGPRVQDAGVRLHRRFVTLFSLAAVLPAIVVALFFGLLVTQGVDNWFSSRVRTVVENAAETSKAYDEEQRDFIGSRMGPMIADLNRPDVVSAFARARLSYSALLAQATARDFAAVYVIDHEGRILARAEADHAPAYEAPPPDVFTASTAAAAGFRETPIQVEESQNAIRVAYPLHAYPDAFLYVVRTVRPGMLAQLRSSEKAVIAYRDAERSRTRVQTVFALSYASTALLVLIGAVWVGLGAATQIATPVARLWWPRTRWQAAI